MTAHAWPSPLPSGLPSASSSDVCPDGVAVEACAAPPASTAPVSSPALEALAALQARGADRLQPLPFKALQLLAERVASAPAHRAQRLQARLDQGLRTLHTALHEREAEARQRIDALALQAPEAAREMARRLAAQDWVALRHPTGRPPAPPQPGALAELTAYLNQASAHLPTEGEVRLHGGLPELKSAARFRPGWTRLRAEQRVRQALSQAPDQAGPFNSQMLLLRSLELLRKLSPAYLEHLVAQVDSLLWLEQAQIKAPRRSQAAKSPSKASGKAVAAPVKTPRRKAS